jgi:hypothetical protein
MVSKRSAKETDKCPKGAKPVEEKVYGCGAELFRDENRNAPTVYEGDSEKAYLKSGVVEPPKLRKGEWGYEGEDEEEHTIC